MPEKNIRNHSKKNLLKMIGEDPDAANAFVKTLEGKNKDPVALNKAARAIAKICEQNGDALELLVRTVLENQNNDICDDVITELTNSYNLTIAKEFIQALKDAHFKGCTVSDLIDKIGTKKTIDAILAMNSLISNNRNC